MRSKIPQFIGASVRRREDPALVTGRGHYTADVPLEGAATLAFVRSPYAHAKVLGVSTADAGSTRGVLGVFTGRDLRPQVTKAFPFASASDSGRFEELNAPERLPLAVDRVRYVGEPVAVVAAEDPYVAADAVEAVEVDYEPLDPVVDPQAALEQGAELLHPELGTNRAFVWSVEGGDPSGIFESGATVVELRAKIQRLVPNAMEPRAAAAVFHHGDGVTLWSTTQIPHSARDLIASLLGMERDALRVIAPEVGGGFGAKVNIYGEEVVAVLLARHLERPVRWVASRSEDYLATSHGRDQRAVLRLAASSEGKLLGIDVELVMDCGAYYSRVTPIIPALTGAMIPGVYDVQNVRVRATGVFTNKSLSEPYRGAGRPEATYLIERGMDVLARKLAIDPAELRRRNFIPPSSFPYRTATGLTYDSGEYARSLDEALKRVDYPKLRARQKKRRENGGKLLGIGVASYVEICGFGPWELGAVRVGPDGKVRVLTGTSPHGQGHETTWAQIVAETLQVELADIEVLHGDTKIIPKGIGTFGSRSAPVGGSAVLEGAETVREGAKEIAAHLLEAAAADIELESGRFQVVGVPGRGVGWREVAAKAYADALPEELRGKLDATREFQPPGETYPFGTHVSVVEIDPETGEIEVLRFLSVDDCGRVINPLLVQGQVHGGIAQGIGQALWESAVYDESGNFVTGNLMEYTVPRADMLPRYETNRTETPTPLNALGVKGIGEAATIGSTPAVVNAVVDALSHLGVDHVDTPLTPEKIWTLLQSAGG